MNEAKQIWEDAMTGWNPERRDRPKVVVTDNDIETLTLKNQASYWMLPGTSDQNPREIVSFIDDVMRLLPVPRICAVEIGLGAGGTHILLTKLFHSVITVERDRDRACHTGLGLGADSTIIVANSKDPRTVDVLKTEIADRPVDLLFIDGLHSYDTCRSDHELYAPLVRPGGIVAFHDSAKSDCGVKDYLVELPCEYVLKRYEFMITKTLDDTKPKFKEFPDIRQGIAYYVVST